MGILRYLRSWATPKGKKYCNEVGVEDIFRNYLILKEGIGMFKNKGKFLVALFIISALILSIITISNNKTHAQGEKTVEEFFKPIGEFIQNNPNLLKDSIKNVNNLNVSLDETVAVVNNLPITIGELEYRKGLNQKAGIRNQSYSETFNALVEEKIVLDYAIRNNLLPTEFEVQNFIENEQHQYTTNDEYRKLVDAFCKAANMPVEKYWSTYEWYNAFRILAFKNSFENATKRLDSEQVSNMQNEKEKYKRKETMWKDLKLKFKSESKIKINDKFKGLNIVLDRSKLYL